MGQVPNHPNEAMNSIKRMKLTGGRHSISARGQVLAGGPGSFSFSFGTLVRLEDGSMRQGLLFVTMTCLMATDVFACNQPDPDEEKIKGTWVIVASEQAGSEDGDLKGCILSFAAGKIETDAHREKGVGKYTLDSRAKPKILDMTLNVAGPVTRLGVYSLTEDTLTIRLGSGVDRPAQVQGATEKDGSWLLVLKRDSKKYAWTRLIRDVKHAAAEAFLTAGDTVEELLAGTNKYYIGQIIVTGNSRISDRVIREQIPLYPGQPLRFWRMYVAEYRLESLGCFDLNPSKNIRPRVKVDLPMDVEIRFLDIYVEVVEKTVPK
jgi:uncharacterized protein (TIGR03067 family)